MIEACAAWARDANLETGRFVRNVNLFLLRAALAICLLVNYKCINNAYGIYWRQSI